MSTDVRVQLKGPLTASTRTTPAKKRTAIQAFVTMCAASPTLKADPVCGPAIVKATTAVTALGTNVDGIDALDVKRKGFTDAQPQLVADAEAGCDTVVTVVAQAVQDNPSILQELKVEERPKRVVLPVGAALGVPDGAAVKAMKKGGVKFSWLAVLGAAGYTAQQALVPATGDPAWALLTGKGKSRKLLDLVPGQKYMFRVCAVGGDTRASGWSAVITFTAPATS